MRYTKGLIGKQAGEKSKQDISQQAPITINVDGSITITIQGNTDEKAIAIFKDQLEAHRKEIARIVQEEVAKAKKREY